jgi:cellulose synthase operon protein B
MTKMVRSFFYALVLASLLSSLSLRVGSAAPSAQVVSSNPAVIRFDQLGQIDNILRGPYGTENLRFGLPANWAFGKGASLQLIITADVVTNGSQVVAEGQSTGATLNVTMDKQSVATIPLQAGSNVTYNIPIPGTALVPSLSDGRHELQLFLDASNDCNNNTSHQTTVVVSGASFFTIPYTESEPATDLTMLPRPIYQRGSVFPVNVVEVVPDAPSAGELQAALTVASSFGRMSGGDMPFSMVTQSGLTPEMRTESQLIFVGKAASLSLLQGATLPSPLQEKAFAAPGMQADDGIMQLAVSPWNTGRSIMVVGGNSDAGVIKAAQALSTTNIQTVGDHNLALIADVTPATSTQPNTTLPQAMNTLGDLGYESLTLNGVGRSEAFVRFTVPPGFVSSEDAYLDLTFNHSGMLDFNRSGLSVFLNGDLISSLLLSEQTAATNTQRIKIPASSLTSNSNELRFQVDLAPLSQCSLVDGSNMWLTILPASVINLPLSPATANTAAPRDMGAYPNPFTGEPSLANLNFILSRNDPASWDMAAQIALQLGRQASGAIFSPGASFDGEISDQVRKNNNLIVVGLPTNMKIFGDLNNSLPAPFDKGTNVAVLKGQQVAYRFPADSSLGFLQLVQSPWNSNNVILAVTGTTDDGMRQAGNALLNPVLRSRLKGNFALVNGQTLSIADTRTGLGMAGVSADGNAAAEIPVTSGETNSAQAPANAPAGSTVGWIPMVVGGLLIAIVIVIIVAALTRRRVVLHQ